VLLVHSGLGLFKLLQHLEHEGVLAERIPVTLQRLISEAAQRELKPPSVHGLQVQGARHKQLLVDCVPDLVHARRDIHFLVQLLQFAFPVQLRILPVPFRLTPL